MEPHTQILSPCSKLAEEIEVGVTYHPGVEDEYTDRGTVTEDLSAVAPHSLASQYRKVGG